MLQQIKNMIGQNVENAEETDKEDTILKPTQQQYQSPYANATIEYAFKHGKGQRNYSTLDNEFKEIKDKQLIKSLIRSYQTRGHISASLDPLGKTVSNEDSEAKQWRRFFPDEASLDAVYLLPETTFIGGGEVDRLPLREIIRRLEAAYCGCVGAEYSLVESFEERQWIRQHLEPPIVYEGSRLLSTGERIRTLERLIQASAFEYFLASFWGSEPRFGVEGCEILIPTLCQLIEVSSGLGVDTFVIGMPHRGRLNVLANVCQVPLHKIFALFAALPQGNPGSGDVKYHLGTCREFACQATGKKVCVSLMCNPSHLEAVNPVALGRARAEQRIRDDANGSKVMCIIVHGDAALSGQGVAYECVQLSQLGAYSVHGTIHVVLNNQMGSTTDPGFFRSSRYCTDVFRVTATPVLHVNADEADAVIRCCNVAASYRNKFKKDIVLDLVAYRRYGHTEHDDPSVTQPARYKKIEGKCPVTKIYQEKLQKEGLVSVAATKKILKDYHIICTQEMSKAQRETCHRMREWSDVPPDRWVVDTRAPFKQNTGVESSALRSLGEALLKPPANIDLHLQVKHLIESRLEKLEKGLFDWAMAEALAIATLLIQGVHVRFTGQDIQTGMFSGRHWVLYDQNREGVQWVPLHNVPGAKATLEFSNSPVAEYSTMGFEVGYSTSTPNQLIMWETQFGDFCNLAQCVIDQFLAAGESKWGQSCGLVLLCPHGLEGAGPEHSSGRLERFLQLCADDYDVFPDVKNNATPLRQLRAANLLVVNCSSPANLFHVLRLQATTPVRKPLILFTHKTLLKHPFMISKIEDILPGTQFQRVLSEFESIPNRNGIIKLIFCTGRIYYDLCEERTNQGLEKCVAIARIEQLSPFPYDRVHEEAKRFPSAVLIWVQHEHKNQGAWNYVQPRFGSLLPDRPIIYVGRNPSPAPATGSIWRHHLETRQLLEAALDISSMAIPRK